MQSSEDMSNVAKPASMRYGFTAIDAVPSSLTTRRFDSNNGSVFTPSGASEIRIPVSADGFLDVKKHYLEFSIKNTTATANNTLTLDGDAACIIDELRIESEGVEIERISRYNLLSVQKMANDSTKNDIMKRSAQTGGGVATSPAVAAGAATAARVDSPFTSAGRSIDKDASSKFVLPLNLSGFLNNRFGKALPMGMNEFTIIIRLQSAAVAYKSVGAAPDYSVSTPVLFCPTYKIEDMAILQQYQSLMMQRGVNFLGNTYKTYINAIPVGASSQRAYQINDRSTSVLAFINVIRETAVATATADLSLSASSWLGVDNYRHNIAGVNYPPDLINVSTATDGLNIGRVYNEMVKSYAEPGFVYSNSLINEARAVNTSTQGKSDGEKAACVSLCIDLKRFDDRSLALIGLNTAANASPNTLELSTLGTMLASDLTTFALVEAEFSISPQGRLAVAM